MGTQNKESIWPLGPAASLALLKGRRTKAGEAMKLTFLELATLGKLRIYSDPPEPRRFWFGSRSGDASAWVPTGAERPEGLAARSVFDAAARVSSEADRADVKLIAHGAGERDGNMRGSRMNAWLARYAFKELYNKDLMRTRKRFPLRGVPVLTEEGRAAKAELRRRLESLEQMPGMDKRMAANTLHLSGTSFLLVESSWPAIEAFVASINEEQKNKVGAGGGGGGGEGGSDSDTRDGDDDSFDFGELDLGDLFGGIDLDSLDFGGLGLGGIDFGGGGDGGGGGGGGGGGS